MCLLNEETDMINRPDIKVIKTIYEKLPVYERLLDNMELEINEIAEFCNLPIIKRKNLIEQGGAEVTDFFGVIGLPFLNYQKVLENCNVTTLINYDSE